MVATCLAVAAVAVSSAGASAFQSGAITAGYGYTCATRTSDATVVCWGVDGAQQVEVPLDLGSVKALSAESGGAHTCAIKASDNTVECWGDDVYGETDVPAGLGAASGVSSGANNTCAIKSSDGTVVCWGDNYAGQSSVPAGLGAVSAIAAGDYHTCAVKTSDGTVACWGDNSAGELSVPAGLGAASAISAGGYHTCAIRASDSTVVCWGFDVGGDTTPPSGLGAVSAISAGEYDTCAIKASNGAVVCWGPDTLTTVPAGLGAVTAVAVGQEDACAIRAADSTVVCWGNPEGGATSVPAGAVAAGNSNTCAINPANLEPVCWGGNDYGQSNVPAGTGTLATVSDGYGHACGMRQADSTVVCWGSNIFGETTIPAGLGAVREISAGGYNNCAIEASDGSVVCWGWNSSGQSNVPADLGAANAVSAGLEHTCAIRASDGTLECWGYDYYGETHVPASLGAVTAVSAGYFHTCAIKASDSTVVCWGINDDGQSTVPSGLGAVSAVSAGGGSSCAIKASDGTLVCWGDNQYGESTVPAGLGPVSEVSVGGAHACALTVSGRVVCWGSNYAGQTSVPFGAAPVSLAASPLSATEGAAFSRQVATFSDTDAQDASAYTATIDWGDGTTSAGTVSETSSGQYAVSGSHTYADEGSYTLSVTAVDSDGSTASGSAAASVTDAPLSADLLSVSGGTAGISAASASFRFTDANPGATAGDFSATFDWGDGAQATGTVSQNPDGSFTATPTSHIYAAAGGYTVAVSVQDAGGSTTSAWQNVTVKAAQTIAFPPTAVTYGQPDFSPAAASSGLAVSYGNPSGACTIDLAGLVQITGAGSCTVTATQGGNAAYAAAAPVTQTFPVDRAPLTVDANDASTVYGNAPTLGYTLHGFVNGENPGSANVSGSGSCAVSSGTPSDAGVYPGAIACIPGSLTAPNYSFAVGSPGTLTITKAPQAIAIISVPPAAPTFGGSYMLSAIGGSSGNPVTFSVDLSSTAGACSISGATVSFTGVGLCVVDADQAGSSDYFAAPQRQQTLTIAPAILTVTADNQSRLFGAANPPLTATISGFVAGENLASSGVTGAPSCTTTAIASSPVGTYPITCTQGTLAAANYVFVFAPGSLTVTVSHVIDTTVHGPLFIGFGQAVEIATGGRVDGPITLALGGSLDIEGGTVTGPIFGGAAGAVRVCGARIDGPLKLADTVGPVVLGDGTSACRGSTFSGPVGVETGSGGVSIENNAIGGPLDVKSNDGGVIVTGNTIQGPLTVLHNTGAVVDSPNTVHGPSRLQ